MLMTGTQIGTLYKLLGRIDANSCYDIVIPEIDNISSCLANPTMLWNRWLGHIGKKGLRAMQSKVMAKVFPNCSFEFDVYEHCIYGK